MGRCVPHNTANFKEEQIMKLKGMSKEALRSLAKRALLLADDLEREEPSYALAIENGVDECGSCEITMDNGKKWKAVGHGPRGDAYYVSSEGYIEFIPLESEK
jgi:hypothetical protein